MGLSGGASGLDSSTTVTVLLRAYHGILPAAASPPLSKLVGVAQNLLLENLQKAYAYAQNATDDGGADGGGGSAPLAKRPKRPRSIPPLMSPKCGGNSPGGSSVSLEKQVLKVYRSMLRAIIVENLLKSPSPVSAITSELAAVNDWMAE